MRAQLVKEDRTTGARKQKAGTSRSWGFSWGLVTGIVLALVALLTVQPDPTFARAQNDLGVAHWLHRNLGYSVWLFSFVLVLFALKLKRLLGLLNLDPLPVQRSRDVAALDQMLDVWIQVFIGIGVIWTAVGMRGALQAALGEPDAALADSAGNVLRKLVDGGILLALTTTIVGAVGGYLMRVVKTAFSGAELQSFYEALDRQEIQALLSAAQRIEGHLQHLSSTEDNITPLQSRAL